MLLRPVLMTPLYELRLPPLPLIAQLLLLLPMAELQVNGPAIISRRVVQAACAGHATSSSLAVLPAATSTINASKVTSAHASGGLHSSTPVNIAGFSSARAGSTAAGTAALAAGM
ncbi:TPA: hypothetical protein ACH3X1_004151 [Trebouxia sp. C0004]